MAKAQTKANGIAEQLLAEVIKRIVAIAKPQKIILSGSGARGQLVATSEDLERYKDSPTVVIAQALKEGMVIYDKAA